jgi:hypothetical protein
MFERVAPSEEQLDAEAREGRSPDQIASLRLAAILVAVDAVLTLAMGIAFGILGTSVIGIAIRLVMAYYLYKLRPRAEALALGLTILGGAATLFGIGRSMLVGGFSIFPFLFAIPELGRVLALLLLLLGDPPREKRLAAIVVFAVLVCLPELLLIVLQLAGAIHTVNAPTSR